MPCKVWTAAFVAALLLSTAASAKFEIKDADGRLIVSEMGKPVLEYNYGRVNPPAQYDADRYWRSSYIHPLYGLDGAVITDDFPADHPHQRGVFWTWPETRVGDRKMDVWTIVGARQLFQQWLKKETTDSHAEIGVENAWFFDEDPEPKVQEQVFITVHPAEENSRAIDFRLNFKNLTEEVVTFEGAKEKGYGGFLFRPMRANEPFQFLTAAGVVEDEALSFDTPWAGVRWTPSGQTEPTGVVIFQHPTNPGFPHDGWIFRHYALLGASWPHETPYALHPGESFQLRYRLLVIHNPTVDALKGEFARYTRGEHSNHRDVP